MKISDGQAVEILASAIAEAKILASANKYYSAVQIIYDACSIINNCGEWKITRMLFSRPGGSMDSMGSGCEIWKADKKLVKLFYEIKRVYASIPSENDGSHKDF